MQQQTLQPYVFFNGRCEEAIDFYRGALGAEVVQLLRFKDSPEPSTMPLPPGSESKGMHSGLRFGNSTLLASDGMCTGKPQTEGVSLAYATGSDAEAERVFAALGDGGQVHQPLIPTFFSSRFG